MPPPNLGDEPGDPTILLSQNRIQDSQTLPPQGLVVPGLSSRRFLRGSSSLPLTRLCWRGSGQGRLWVTAPSRPAVAPPQASAAGEAQARVLAGPAGRAPTVAPPTPAALPQRLHRLGPHTRERPFATSTTSILPAEARHTSHPPGSTPASPRDSRHWEGAHRLARGLGEAPPRDSWGGARLRAAFATC